MKTSLPQTFTFPEVRVVEASAGSGKTYALAKRYVQLLLNPSRSMEEIPIRNILAITFTNKAAFEMKARILEFLKAIAFKQLPQEQINELLDPLGVSHEQAARKAFAIMEDLIHHYNFFQVQTIDKFINALLSGCAFNIGLTANFKIKTNSFDYLQHSLDELIDQAQSDKNLSKLFHQFLHHYLYLENRSGWFPKEDMLHIVNTLFKQHNAYGFSFVQSNITSEDVMKKKASILKEISALRHLCPDGTDKRFVKALDSFLERSQQGFDVDRISDYFAREVLPVRKGVQISEELDHLWGRIRQNIHELCEEEAYSLFNPYINVFNETMQAFKNLSAKDDVLFLEELNKKAGLLFDEDYITVAELYYRLATRFHHYLIDEFQDTSKLQWHNLQKMAEEALSTGGSLFYVGDRKQAIYGFRGGDVELFDEVKGEFDAFNVQIEQLAKNWRSQKCVVDFNNHIFATHNIRSFIAQKEAYENEKKKRNPVAFFEEDLEELDHVFAGAQQSVQEKNDGGYVRMEYIDIDKKQERDEILRERILTLVGELKQRFAYSEIAILTRGNKQIEQVTNWLLEEEIPVESERTSNIKENTLIQELVAFLRFLNSPIDNVAFTSFILGDLFSTASGLKKEKLHGFVFSLRENLKKENNFTIYTAFRDQYPEIWKTLIDPFFKNVGLYPLYELLVSIYKTYDCLKTFIAHQGFLMHFLELVKKTETDYAEMGAFLDYFEALEGEDLYVHVTDSNAIKVLTTHKSKGLEFPVVILPFLGMDIQIGASSADNKQSYILQRYQDKMRLLRLKRKYLNFSDDLYQIYRREYKKSFLSELNNIYVGLTRAKYELYGFIPKRVKNSFNFARFLIPEDLYESGEQKTYTRPSKEVTATLSLPPSNNHDWIAYLKDEFAGVDHLTNRDVRLRGEVVHFMLSLVGDLTSAKVKPLIEEAAQKAVLTFAHIDDLENETELLDRILNSKELQPFFYAPSAKIFTEKEIVTQTGMTKRIDRLMVTKEEAWVIDYKLSYQEEAGYEEQVKEYVDLIRSLYPKHRTRGFLVYLESAEVQEI